MRRKRSPVRIAIVTTLITAATAIIVAIVNTSARPVTSLPVQGSSVTVAAMQPASPRAGEPTVTDKSATPESRYTFETGVTGWMPQTAADTRACWRVNASADQHHGPGLHALQMMLTIDGSDATKGKGEAWVDVSTQDGTGKRLPVDLHDRLITAWIYAPAGAYGPVDNPNGVQLFVKDAAFRSMYSGWQHAAEGLWFQVRLPMSGQHAGFIQPGFDPSQIVAVGVKFGVGDRSTATYVGPVFVDNVNW